MTKTIQQEAEVTKPAFPKAEGVNHWVAVARLPANISDEGRRIEAEKLVIYYSSKVHFSKVGLGVTRVKRATIEAKESAYGVLASTVANSTGIGSAAAVNRGWMAGLIADTPVITELGGMVYRMAQTVQAMESLESLPFRQFASYRRLDGWQHSAVGHPIYGLAYVPKAMAEHLLPAEGVEVDEELRFTHVLCDVLQTKRSLMQELGFDGAITLDEKLVANALSLREVP